MFELMDSYSENAVIKVIGIGGGGGNAVQHMVKSGVDGVDFICINTDSQALKGTSAKTSLQIGCNITKGLGAGANPNIGREAAIEDRERLQEVIEVGVCRHRQHRRHRQESDAHKQLTPSDIERQPRLWVTLLFGQARGQEDGSHSTIRTRWLAQSISTRRPLDQRL